MGRGIFTGLRGLMEAIILQALDDLGSSIHRKESIEFFKGNGFKVCAKIAGLDLEEQSGIFLSLRR